MITAETLAGPILSLVLGYLLGSIPFGIVLTRMTGAGDLRRIGSGNIGATNVLRTGRKGLAAATLVLDALKATAAVLIAQQAWGLGALAAIGAFLGHLWPVWLRFRGGKGVATLLGLMIGLHWPSAIVYAAIWLGTLGATRISSLAGMLAGISAPIAAGLFGRIDLAVLFLGFALLLLWKHRENVARLIAGTEPRIGRAGDA